MTDNGGLELHRHVHVCVEIGFGVVFYRRYRDRNLSFLVRKSECIPWDGIEDVCRVVVGYMQPDGWKTAS